MRKTILIFMALIICISFCSCAIDGVKPEETVETKAFDTAKARIMAECAVKFHSVGVPKFTNTYIKEMENNIYKIDGTVTIKDRYNIYYTGLYEAYVTCDFEAEEYDVSKLTLGTFYKD